MNISLFSIFETIRIIQSINQLMTKRFWQCLQTKNKRENVEKKNASKQIEKKNDKWNRTWRNRKLTRNVFANIYWFKYFEFDWFENKFNHRIKIWRNTILYEITFVCEIAFAIAFVKIARKKRTHLMSLQIKWIQLFNEYAKQIVHDEIKFRYKNSKRNRRIVEKYNFRNDKCAWFDWYNLTKRKLMRFCWN